MQSDAYAGAGQRVPTITEAEQVDGKFGHDLPQ
jgi:hypothetical protein